MLGTTYRSHSFLARNESDPDVRKSGAAPKTDNIRPGKVDSLIKRHHVPPQGRHILSFPGATKTKTKIRFRHFYSIHKRVAASVLLYNNAVYPATHCHCHTPQNGAQHARPIVLRVSQHSVPKRPPPSRPSPAPPPLVAVAVQLCADASADPACSLIAAV